MAKVFQIDYTAVEPVWGDVRLNADDADEAEVEAKIEIARMYPEYSDIAIEHVEEITEIE